MKNSEKYNYDYFDMDAFMRGFPKIKDTLIIDESCDYDLSFCLASFIKLLYQTDKESLVVARDLNGKWTLVCPSEFWDGGKNPFTMAVNDKEDADQTIKETVKDLDECMNGLKHLIILIEDEPNQWTLL